MTTIRAVFLGAVRHLADLLGSDEVAARWTSPSALPQMTVGALAGHAGRAATWAVEENLADPPPTPGATLVSAAAYYAAVPVDASDPVHRMVMERGAQIAEAGPGALRERVAASLNRLASLVHDLPTDHCITVLGSTPMNFDEYLKTRIVETVLHTDDLAVSVGLGAPPVDAPAGEVIAHLSVDIARLRAGELAVVRAFYRRERQSCDALRVF